MPLQIEVRKERNITVLGLTGSVLAADGASDLRESLDSCFADRQFELVLDVQRVSGIDGGGIAVLRSSQDEARKAGGDVRIARPRYMFLAALAVFDASTAFPYHADADSALDGFSDAKASRNSVKHFDILEFVQQQEREDQEAAQGEPKSES